MNIFSALVGTSFPFAKIGKILGYLAIIAGIFFAGYHYGSSVAEAEGAKKLLQANEKTAEAQRELMEERLSRAKEKAAAADAAASAVIANREEVRKVQDENQAKITKINQEWFNKVKEIKDAAQEAIYKASHPVVTDDPTDDGMWVDVYGCQDGAGAAGSGANAVSKASNSPTDSVQRCRLHPSTAKRLIERAAEANKIVADLNSCIHSLRVLSPDSFADKEQ
jgi:coenzyme F420-reducing hydrogenase delta subunit